MIDSSGSEDVIDDDIRDEVKQLFGDLRPLSGSQVDISAIDSIRERAKNDPEKRSGGLLPSRIAGHVGIPDNRAANWLCTQVRRMNSQVSLASNGSVLASISMLLRDTLVHHFDIPYICVSEMSAKYSSILS